MTYRTTSERPTTRSTSLPRLNEPMRGGASIFDSISCDDLVLAFFPCIYFCESSQCAFRLWHFNYKKLNDVEKIEKILIRSENRHYFYTLLIKLAGVCLAKELRLIIENPWSGIGYLRNNFLFDPSLIDDNRMMRGDYFKKPTAYWFLNCNPTHGETLCKDKEQKKIRESKSASESGLCSEDRSMISPDYARNFICDFIIGKEQIGTQLSFFAE